MKLSHFLLITGVLAQFPATTGFCSDATNAAATGCVITLDCDRQGPLVSKYLTGFNLSYFNDLDTLWQDQRIPGYLKQIKSGLLRYPGGEETSRFHWEQPGTRGYMDAWNKTGPHTPKWSRKDIQIDDPNYMDTLEYLKWCDWIGSEPMLGVNVSSGILLNRLNDSLDEIDRWHTYCRDRGYKVKYWYVDNEVWHDEANTYVCMDIETYADVVRKVSKLLKEKDPDVQIICNPVNELKGPGLNKFLALCGRDIDIIDIHWYWNWGRASFEAWLADTPLTTDSQWKKTGKTYAETIQEFNALVKKAGFKHIKLAAHEWNVGPSPKDSVLQPFEHALISAEIMMQFAEGGLHSACMWPLLWTYDREKMLKQIADGTFNDTLFGNRSIVYAAPPHGPTPTLSSFTMFSKMLEGTVIGATCNAKEIAVLAVRQNEVILLYILNKSAEKNPVNIRIEGADAFTSATYEVLTSADVHSADCKVESGSCAKTADHIEYNPPQYSLTLLTLEK